MEQQNIPNVTFDELVAEVEKSLKDMHNELRKQRNKLGAMYNQRNNYEQLERRFGEDPRKLIAEYNLILEKKSSQPVSVREPIKHIVAVSMNRLIEAKAKEAMTPAEPVKPKKQRKTTQKKDKLNNSVK